MSIYPDAYAHIYQKMEGFKIKIYASENKLLEGYLSLKPSTRSTYDIAMRDATIDGLITMDQIQDLKPSQIFYRVDIPEELFILQSVNEFEFQKNTRNINAIKQNCFVNVQRRIYDEETDSEKYTDIYTDLVSFVTMQNKDEKNFAAGIEDNTIITIQIPKRNRDKEIALIETGDRIILKNIEGEISKRVKIESVNAFGVPGIIMIYGTFDTRTGDE